jgi:hypothetical protein
MLIFPLQTIRLFAISLLHIFSVQSARLFDTSYVLIFHYVWKDFFFFPTIGSEAPFPIASSVFCFSTTCNESRFPFYSEVFHHMRKHCFSTTCYGSCLSIACIRHIFPLQVASYFSPLQVSSTCCQQIDPFSHYTQYDFPHFHSL